MAASSTVSTPADRIITALREAAVAVNAHPLNDDDYLRVKPLLEEFRAGIGGAASEPVECEGEGCRHCADAATDLAAFEALPLKPMEFWETLRG